MTQKLQRCLGCTGGRREQKFAYCLRMVRLAGGLVGSLGGQLLPERSSLLTVLLVMLSGPDTTVWQQQLALEVRQRWTEAVGAVQRGHTVCERFVTEIQLGRWAAWAVWAVWV